MSKSDHKRTIISALEQINSEKILRFLYILIGEFAAEGGEAAL